MKKILTLLFIVSLVFSFSQSTKKYYHNIDAQYKLKIGDVGNSAIGSDTLLVVDGEGNVGFMLGSEFIINGEVIGDFLYLFQSDDTVIVDLSSLAGGGDTSLWEISEGKLQPKNETPFIQEFQGVQLKNDSVDLGFSKIPFTGTQSVNINSWLGLSGYIDLTDLGADKSFIKGYFDFNNDNYNALQVVDTTGVYINANEEGGINSKNISLNADEQISLTIRDTSESVVEYVEISNNNIEIGDTSYVYLKFKKGSSTFTNDTITFYAVIVIEDEPPTYATDTDADNDTGLPSGGIYHLTGDRTPYRKP